MSDPEIEDAYRQMSADFLPYLSGRVEEAWARCLPVWRERGRIEDYPRGTRRPRYLKWWGKCLAEEFAGKFRDDHEFLVRQLSSADPFIEITAVELLDYVCENFEPGGLPGALLSLKHPLPRTIKEEVEGDWIYRGQTIETVGDLLRCDHAVADMPGIVEAEQEMAVTFQMTSLSQIRLVRAIAPDLVGFSTAELAARARTNGLQVTVSGLTMWRARDYVQKARKAGLEAVIVSGQAEGEAP